ncbi:MAG: DEAD/DEAH box helicase family protein [Chloroflexi bacterium]|nr:DEAD/DEAH box helicase family protein [Chloroflexota bacterium]
MAEQIYVSIDMEMTSARPENQEILEIAAVKFRGTEVLDSWSTLVNPRCSIPYSIQMLTGIKQEDVNRAPALAEVIGDFLKFVKNYPLIAHSVAADVTCLDRKGVHLDNQQIDTFELACILLPHLASYSLESVATYLNVSFRKTHRAADDALTQKEVLVALVRRAEELDLSIVQEINRLVAPTTWQMKEIFREIERRKSFSAFGGSSIRQQLAAKSGLEVAALDLAFVAEEPEEPLVPASKRRPIDKLALKSMLGPDGLFSQKFDRYEHRPQQVQMMEAVADAFDNGENLIVEAGTGTGKSVAYLLPAAHFAVQNSERVVVSTNTINLQDQLFNKDIPSLQSILPFAFKSALVKGRSNYLCLSRWAALQRHHEIKPEEIQTLIKILIWLPTTQTGDVAELSRLSGDEAGVWKRISAANEGCNGSQCTHFRKGTCFLYRARRKAESSHIIVANHALVLSDLASDGVLPDYDYLIVDEAQHLEAEATEQLGFSVRESELLATLNELARRGDGDRDRQIGLLPDLKNHFRGSEVPARVQKDLEALAGKLVNEVEEARGAATLFFDRLNDFLLQHTRDNKGYEIRLLLTGGIRRQPAWDDIELTLESLSSPLKAISNGLTSLLTVLSELESYKVLDYDALMADLTRQARFHESVLEQTQVLVLNPQADGIYWISMGAHRNDVALHSAPLHVGQALQAKLYSTKECVVLTSATLSTERKFDFIAERLGFAEANQVIVDSPFDYSRSTLVYVPTDMPEPEKPYYQKHLQQSILDICGATGGRALVLFTSHSQLRLTWQAIRHPLQDQGILVLGHNVDGMPRRQLLQTFKTNPKTVLLGAASFWEGIDVVGDALSVLIITRLPFAVPSDPVFAARSGQFRDPFREFSLPQTILRFKQGFGRLIRSQSDRGVVVILDSRISSKSYGKAFISSLPSCSFRYGPLHQAAHQTIDWLSPVSR